jgi:hypothetical protein
MDINYITRSIHLHRYEALSLKIMSSSIIDHKQTHRKGFLACFNYCFLLDLKQKRQILSACIASYDTCPSHSLLQWLCFPNKQMNTAQMVKRLTLSTFNHSSRILPLCTFDFASHSYACDTRICTPRAPPPLIFCKIRKRSPT